VAKLLTAGHNPLQAGQPAGKLIAAQPIQCPEAVTAPLYDSRALEDAKVMGDQRWRHVEGGADGAARQLANVGKQFNNTISVDVGQRSENADSLVRRLRIDLGLHAASIHVARQVRPDHTRSSGAGSDQLRYLGWARPGGDVMSGSSGRGQSYIERAAFRNRAAGDQFEAVAARGTKAHVLQRHDQVAPGGRPRVLPRRHFRMALDGDHLRAGLVEEVRAERLLAGFIGIPFDEEHCCHVLLHRGKTRRAQLVEDTDQVKPSIRPLSRRLAYG
jgi:hypothetical protein